MNLCDRKPTANPLPILQPRCRTYPEGFALDQSQPHPLDQIEASTSQSIVNSLTSQVTSQASIEPLQAWLTRPAQSQQTLLKLVHDLPLTAIVGLTMVELTQLAAAIEKLMPIGHNSVHCLRCRQWYEQTLQMMQQRQVRSQWVQATLQQNLQSMRALNPRFYDREFSALNLAQLSQKVLDGEEEEFQQALAACCSAVNRFYEHYKLIRLARIASKVQTAKWHLRRTTIACRVFPLLGLLIAGFFLQLSIDWMQAIGLTLLVVSPLVLWITHSMKREMKERAKRELEQRKGLLYDEWQRLNDQETQVLDRLYNSGAAC